MNQQKRPQLKPIAADVHTVSRPAGNTNEAGWPAGPRKTLVPSLAGPSLHYRIQADARLPPLNLNQAPPSSASTRGDNPAHPPKPPRRPPRSTAPSCGARWPSRADAYFGDAGVIRSDLCRGPPDTPLEPSFALPPPEPRRPPRRARTSQALRSALGAQPPGVT